REGGEELVDGVRGGVEGDVGEKGDRVRAREIGQRLADLTQREAEVFELVVTGRLNKQIAWKLGISEKTVKVHRARMMEKMCADSVADLVRMAAVVHPPVRQSG